MVKKFVCSSTEPIVQTKAGKIRGFNYDDTYTFHGIKYADAKRFRMPTPVQPWNGVKDALCYGSIAPLLESMIADGDLLIPHRFWAENEDCQYLNVWTRSLDKDAKKPVMVWLHGGGFAGGSSIEMVAYDGDNLSRYGEVVVVSLNHRLNILGYLDLSSYGNQYNNTGNAGMVDIVEALKWIQDNISGFGGDPDNVTIFGQSGGGGKAITLCQIPAATGLFHKAIIMSGVLDTTFGRERNDKAIVDAMLQDLGIASSDVAKLETLPYAQLASAYRRISKLKSLENIQFFNAPLPNDYYLGDPLIVGFSENARKIPVIVGSVVAEFAFNPGILKKNELSASARRELLAQDFVSNADELIRLFKKTYPEKNELDLIGLDAFFRPAILKYLEQRSTVAQAPGYCYLFALEFDYDDGKPAWHCADIPFAFHNTDKVPICNIDGVTERLEEQYSGAYVNFARTGDPNHAALPHWPEFAKDSKATMVFDRQSEAKVDYDMELIMLLEKSGHANAPDMGFHDVE